MTKKVVGGHGGIDRPCLCAVEIVSLCALWFVRPAGVEGKYTGSIVKRCFFPAERDGKDSGGRFDLWEVLRDHVKWWVSPPQRHLTRILKSFFGL